MFFPLLVLFLYLSSSKLKENLTELHIIVRTTGLSIAKQALVSISASLPLTYVGPPYVLPDEWPVLAEHVPEREVVLGLAAPPQPPAQVAGQRGPRDLRELLDGPAHRPGHGLAHAAAVTSLFVLCLCFC